MKNRWKILAARIDALSLRERAFLFLSLIAVCFALADLLWLSPARTEHARARQEFATANTELKRLREAVREKPNAADPVQVARAELARVKAQIDTLNGDLAIPNGPTRGSVSLQEVLVHFLGKQAALSLLHAASLPLEAAPTGTGPAGPPVSVQRQGVEVTVSGPYTELVRYVHSLELAMPDLRWGTMTLMAEQRPAQLKLQVFLVAAQP